MRTRLWGSIPDPQGRYGELARLRGIADIANWSCVRIHGWSSVPIDGLGNLKRRMDALAGRPACQRGVAVPAPIPDLAKDPKATEEFAKNARTILQR